MTQIQHPPADLQILIKKARDYIGAAVPENTRRAYVTDWKHYGEWCDLHGLQAMPATPEAVVLYLTDLAATHRVSTLRRKISSISVAHGLAGHPSPTRTTPVRLCLRGIAREQAAGGERTKYARPLLLEDILGMVRTTDDTPKGKRDAALLLIGFAGGFRRSELADLHASDITWQKEGILIRLRQSKTDQEGAQPEKAIPYGSTAERCPVRTLRAWMDAAEIDEGPIFQRIRKGGTVLGNPITPQAVSLVIVERAKAAGIEVENLSGHSLRSGFVTTALINGASFPEIQKQTGHRSLAVVSRYNRDRVQFRNNAVHRLGL